MENDQINILLLKKQFLCCYPVDKIIFPYTIGVKQQQEILNFILDSRVQKYPIKVAYQQAFLRKLLQKFERNDFIEICDGLYKTYCDLLSVKDESPTHYRHFILEEQDKLSSIGLDIINDCMIIEESKNIISQGTTGLCSWQAAELLAEWCIKNEDEIKDKNILELGSGVGLTGITTIKKCNPRKYTFSDCHPTVLELLKKNIYLNLPLLNVEVIDLAWQSIEKLIINEEADWTSPHLILAADVIYDSTIFYSLIKALKVLLNRPNSYAVIGVTVRNDDTLFTFLTQLMESNLRYEENEIPQYRIFVQSDVPGKIIKIYNNNNQ